MVEEPAVVVSVLALVPAVEGLVHHEQAEAVGDIEKLGRGRVVRRAERVHAHVLEHLEPLLDGAVVHRGAQCARGRLVAGAVQLHALTVQREAVVRVEREGANAEGGCIRVDDRAAYDDRRDH